MHKNARAMKLRAPAKVNLQLRVHGRRDDGFHDIETLVVPISLADEITVETSLEGAIGISCDDPGVPEGRNNLAAAAAHEYSRHTGLQFGARIEISKRIPVGAGLGGGSSNAAAVLIALDSIFETHLDVEELEKLAAKLGSDVPFFIRGIPAFCRGRGEIIEPFDIPERLRLLLLKPPFGVETSWAYKAWAASHWLPDGLGQEQDLGWIKISNVAGDKGLAKTAARGAGRRNIRLGLDRLCRAQGGRMAHWFRRAGESKVWRHPVDGALRCARLIGMASVAGICTSELRLKPQKTGHARAGENWRILLKSYRAGRRNAGRAPGREERREKSGSDDPKGHCDHGERRIA